MKPQAFLVDKPEGMGSTDVVRHFKKNLEKPFKKAGHFGTLDPFATGLLIVGINGAQRLADYIHQDYPKTYKAIGIFGKRSSTGDKTGEISEGEPFDSTENLENLKELLENKFKGDYLQKPHAYSATKHKGKNLYEYAREGVVIDKPAVKRFIHNLKINQLRSEQMEFEVTVSSGTYIRVLFEDMAKLLGTVGYLSELRRTRIGPLDVSQAFEVGIWPASSIDLDKLYSQKTLILDNPDELKNYQNGIALTSLDLVQQLSNDEKVWLKCPDGALLGLARRVGDKIKALFNFPQSN